MLRVVGYEMFRFKILGYEVIGLQNECYKFWLQNLRYEMSKLRLVWQPSLVARAISILKL